MSTGEKRPALAKRRGLAWAVTVSLVFPAPAVQARQTPPSVTPGAPTMSDAKALYVQRRYVEAARAFETLDTPGAVYNAAMARTAAGHDAHALLRWTRYLELASDDERAEVQQRIDEARELTVEVKFVRSTDTEGARTLVLRANKHTAADDLRVPWPADLAEAAVFLDPGSWSATLEGAEGPPRSQVVTVSTKTAGRRFDLAPAPEPSPVHLRIRPARALRRGVVVEWTGPRNAAERRVITTETSQWKLAPGSWQLAASARGYAAVDRPVDVKDQPVELALELRRPRDRARIGLGVGLGVAALGLAVGGGALLVLATGTASELPELDGTLNQSNLEAEPQITRLWRQQAAGVTLLSAGGATAVAALTGGLTRNRKVAAIESGLGAALGIAGISMNAWAQRCPTRLRNDAPVPDKFVITQDQVERCTSEGRPGALLTGIGIGLLVSAAVALIATRTSDRHTRKRLSARFSSTVSSIAIKGSF
jgi:hypothetical protein